MVASVANGEDSDIVRIPAEPDHAELAQVIDLGDGDAHLAYLARVGLWHLGGARQACVTEAQIGDAQVVSLDAFRSRHPHR